MNYETASDFELNKRLAELLGFKFRVDGDKLILAIKHQGSNVISIEGTVDYCTDWNATMPMAVEHGAYYYPSKNGYEGRVVTKQDRNGHYYNQKSNEDNPLRAIVICLIKVLESKQ